MIHKIIWQTNAIDLTGYFEDTAVEHRVLPAADWTAEVIDYFHKPDLTAKVQLPWRKTHADFHFRPGEVSLWAGINGHGKSQIIGQVAHELCRNANRVALASLEMRPVATMARMCRQAFGAEMPPKHYLEKFGKWTDGKLWLYDHVGSSNPRTIAAVIRYAVEKFGIHHFVVDNLMKVVAGEDDYNAQKDFVNALCTIARDTGCHIHLVLHIKKLKDELAIPNKFDIKGSGAMTDLVDNIFIVWRNKAKEAAMRMGETYDPDDPDCLLILDKQRNGEAEGRYRLFFDQASMQYLEHRHDRASHNKAEIGIGVDEVTT